MGLLELKRWTIDGLGKREKGYAIAPSTHQRSIDTVIYRAEAWVRWMAVLMRSRHQAGLRPLSGMATTEVE